MAGIECNTYYEEILGDGGDERYVHVCGHPKYLHRRQPAGGGGSAAAAAQSSDFMLPLIDIPGNRAFIRQADACVNLEIQNPLPSHRLVAMEAVVEEAFAVVIEGLSSKSDPAGYFRVPPLVFSRLARGGKTTALRLLFNRLKEASIPTVIITFNGHSGFSRRVGESQAAAVLRLIGSQLVDCAPSERQRIVCDQASLDAFLGNDGPLVLLVDELNALARPLDSEAALLMRSMFLDRSNRYLVLTTHMPMGVEPSAPAAMGRTDLPSTRGCRVVALPTCTDVALLQSMHDGCNALTPAEVALYGGIPSLMFSVKVLGEYTPRQRFTELASRWTSMSDEASVQFLKHFVSELLGGDAGNLDVRQFDMFSSAPSPLKIQWPLCYVDCILERINNRSVAPMVRSIRDCICELENLSRRTETGLDWEVVVQIAILLRCMDASYSGSAPPFGLGGIDLFPEVSSFTLPPQVKVVEGAYNSATERLSQCTRPTLLCLTPSYAKFPDFDGFVAFTSGMQDLAIVGYQVKAGRAYPKRDVSQLLGGGILIRGKAPGAENRRRGWSYLSCNGVKELLGCSLAPLYPTDLPDVPVADDFD